MSSGSLASDAWKAWAEPWKLARMLGGRPMSRAARSIAATAWPSATPGARLKDSVTAGNWPWWLTASAALVAVTRVNVPSGTEAPVAARTYRSFNDSGLCWKVGCTSRTT